MNNILYLDDYINLYNNRNKEIIIFQPYKKTLKNGKIIDRVKFIKSFTKLLANNNLKNSIFVNKIMVVINPLWSKEDKKIITDILEELNYKNILFIQELKYLKINSTNLYINYNNKYFYLYYINEKGNTEIKLYDNDINNHLLIDIIKLLNKSNVFIYGKNVQEIDSLLQNSDINYYYFNNGDNLIINFILNDKKV